jgi:hypothetical protein
VVCANQKIGNRQLEIAGAILLSAFVVLALLVEFIGRS